MLSKETALTMQSLLQPKQASEDILQAEDDRHFNFECKHNMKMVNITMNRIYWYRQQAVLNAMILKQWHQLKTVDEIVVKYFLMTTV